VGWPNEASNIPRVSQSCTRNLKINISDDILKNKIISSTIIKVFGYDLTNSSQIGASILHYLHNSFNFDKLQRSVNLYKSKKWI
jgi:hypothetical protein